MKKGSSLPPSREETKTDTNVDGKLGFKEVGQRYILSVSSIHGSSNKKMYIPTAIGEYLDEHEITRVEIVLDTLGGLLVIRGVNDAELAERYKQGEEVRDAAKAVTQ